MPMTRKRKQGSDDLESFDSKMAVPSILNEILKKSVVFASERDISFYMFQNIEIMPDIMTDW